MKYQFVQRTPHPWTPEESEIINNTTELIVQYEGNNPFVDLALHISRSTQVNYVSICEIYYHIKPLVRSLAFVKEDTLINSIEYDLTTSPCQHVIGHNIIYIPDGVKEQYPLNPFLQEHSIQSYLGFPLNDKHDNTIGVITLFHTKPIEKPQFIDYLLSIIAPFLEEKLLLTKTE